MNFRLIYAVTLTVYAAAMSFFAALNVAVLVGESRSEWVFPLVTVVLAALMIWSAVLLWRKKEAVAQTAVSLFAVFMGVSWLMIVPQGLNPTFIAVVLFSLYNLTLLLALISKKVRAALKS